MEGTDKARLEAITKIYQEVLGRDPDTGGLKAYSISKLSIEQIREAIEGSLEAQEKRQAALFSQKMEQADTKELLLMGSSPTEQEHVDTLLSIGVRFILDLNDVPFTSLDTSGFEAIVNVPISKYSPISIEQIDQCFDTIYKVVLVEKKRLFIHSKAGRGRPAIIMALFLAAEKGVPFNAALALLMNKHENVVPSRDLVNSTLLEYVFSLRGKLEEKFGGSIVKPLNMPGKEKDDNTQKALVVSIFDNIFYSRSLDQDVFKYLKENDIATIIDLNTKPLDTASEYSWFRKIHLPVFTDQLSFVLPTIVRSVRKYAGKGKVLLTSKEKGVISILVEKYAKEHFSEDYGALERAKLSLMAV